MSASLFFDVVYGSTASQTLSTGVAALDFKNVDDVATAASASPVSRNGASYVKHLTGRLTGSWTNLLGGSAFRDSTLSGPIGNIAVVGQVTNGYLGSTNGLTAMPSGTVIAGFSNGTVGTSTNGPAPTFALSFGASAGSATFGSVSNNITGTVFTNYLQAQIIVGPSAIAGPIPSMAWRFSINEN